KLLDGVPELSILGSAMTGEDALEAMERTLPDVVLCDLGLPKMSGIEVTRNLKARHPRVEVLIFTIFDEEEKVLDAIRAGAAGYLLKGATADKIVEAIKDVRGGGTVIQPSLARRLLRHFNPEGGFPRVPTPPSGLPLAKGQQEEETPALTPRESEILELIAKGLSNTEAGRVLEISAATIRTHLEHIYAKLEVTNRVEAVTEGIRKGLIDV
ncbi:MAG TPA: response regulator transcription factor, partial [Myxococcales bacterium]|nr:response regulator transcription factor [Myxococcales bacterium]